MLILPLRAINVDSPYNGGVKLPRRLAFLRPEAADAIHALQAKYKRIVLTDAFRSPESSLQAMSEKRGVQPPGFSLHNFGIAVDVAVDATMKRWGCLYSDLLMRMQEFGFWCHRADGQMGFESWHFNYLGDPVAAQPYLSKRRAGDTRTWSIPGEAKILDLYGASFVISPIQAQEILARMSFYTGEVDGIIGPRTTAALLAFQRAWKVPSGTGQLDARTQRVLAVLSAQQAIQ